MPIWCKSVFSFWNSLIQCFIQAPISCLYASKRKVELKILANSLNIYHILELNPKMSNIHSLHDGKLHTILKITLILNTKLPNIKKEETKQAHNL